MTYQKNLQVVYHQQDTGYYCGAASAQMVLEQIGAGLFGQAGLYVDTHGRSRDESHLTTPAGLPIIWRTAPDGLEWTLNDRRPAGFNGVFVEYALNSEDAISRKIAWTIEHYEVAPCALVLGADHWIVIRGMSVSEAPESSTDTSYTFNNFRVNNPWPPVPSSSYWNNPSAPPPPPHSPGDGCGTGGNRGIADEIINYNQWQNTYMTGANYHAQGYWQGKFVAICDPDPPPMTRGKSIPRVRRFDGKRIIDREKAISLVKEFLKNKTLQEYEKWSIYLRNVEPVNAILVQRLDRIEDFYYFIPLGQEKGDVTAALAFDARYGDFLQAISLPEPEPIMSEIPSTETVYDAVINRSYELDKYRGYLPVRKEVTQALNHWVWKPCLESLSPFWPFKMIVSGGNILYYRIDGQVFTSLTEGIYGI